MTARTALMLFVLLLGLNGLHAQDSVKLTSGERLFGEIRSENAEKVEFIDKSGRLLSFPRSEIAELKPGRPLARSLQKELDAIDQNDAAAVLAVAVEASGEKRLKNDALRLCRRVLVLDPRNVRAHEMLGHVRALDQWFDDAAAAEAAIAVVMTEEGREKVGEAWARPEDVEAVKAAPQEWMAVEHRWRLVAEVMKEKGFVDWAGVWYPPEEKEVIRIVKDVERRMGQALPGALQGETTTLDVRGRDSAKRMSAMIEETRHWFMKRFDLPFIEDRPDILNVVLKNKQDYDLFLFECLAIHRIREETIEEYKKNKVPITTFNVASQVHDLESANEDYIDHAVVYSVGERLMDYCWVGEDMWFAPPWLRRAVGQHAEFAVLKTTIIGIGATSDKYGRGGSPVSGEYTLADAKKRLTKLMKKRSLGARWLFGLDRSDLNDESDDFAAVFLAFLFETNADGFNAFIREPDKALEMHERFKRHVGMDFEKADQAFRTWLGL